MVTKARIAVFVSGGGTNLEALLRAQEQGQLPHGEIVLVCASNESAYALTRAADHGVPGVAIPKKQMTQVAFEDALNEKLAEYRVDLIVLAGFLSILSEAFVKRWPERIVNIHPSLIPSFCGKGMYGLKVHEAALAKGVKVTGATVPFVKRWPERIVNIHPSLIPSFCGKGMYGLKVHEAALAKGVKVTGATVHLVNEIPDGGRILLQKAVEVLPGDTPELLQRRVMEQAEWVLLPQAAEMLSKQIMESEAGPHD